MMRRAISPRLAIKIFVNMLRFEFPRPRMVVAQYTSTQGKADHHLYDFPSSRPLCTLIVSTASRPLRGHLNHLGTMMGNQVMMGNYIPPLWPPAFPDGLLLSGRIAHQQRATIKAHPTHPNHPRPYGIQGWRLRLTLVGQLQASPVHISTPPRDFISSIAYNKEKL